MRRARLYFGLGLEGLPGHRRSLRDYTAGGPEGIGPAARGDVHAGDQGRDRARRKHKQYVRNYLEAIRWNKQPPVPSLPDDVVQNTRAKYLDAYRRLTGTDLVL